MLKNTSKMTQFWPELMYNWLRNLSLVWLILNQVIWRLVCTSVWPKKSSKWGNFCEVPNFDPQKIDENEFSGYSGYATSIKTTSRRDTEKKIVGGTGATRENAHILLIYLKIPRVHDFSHFLRKNVEIFLLEPAALAAANFSNFSNFSNELFSVWKDSSLLFWRQLEYKILLRS